MTNWDTRFLDVAGRIATWSKDPRTKVGAIAVRDRRILATGYNGLPRGVADTPDRMQPPAKYEHTLHAEANLPAQAAREGVSLAGSTVYVTHHPCAQCAALLINAGIARIVYGAGKTNMPETTFRASAAMCCEAGVELEAA